MLTTANRENLDDPIHSMVADVKENLDRAHKLWPGNVDRRRLRRIGDCLLKWEKQMFPERRLDFVALSSLGLAMLDELMMYVKDDRRLACLTDIHNGLIKLHQHFDPNFDEPELFDLADRAFDAWKEIQKEA